MRLVRARHLARSGRAFPTRRIATQPLKRTTVWRFGGGERGKRAGIDYRKGWADACCNTSTGSPGHVLAAGFILSGIKGILYLIGGIIAAVISATVAKGKGYSAVLFGVLGFLFSIVTLIVVVLIPRRD